MMKKYKIIYADPPWSFSNTGINGACKKHYKTMTIEQIKNFPVPYLTDKNAVLFLWISNALLSEALEVIKAWGFKIKTVAFTWTKLTVNGKRHIGMGFWTRSNPEMCLLAVKGGDIRPVSHSVENWTTTVVEEHSKKPGIFRNKIVELMGDIPRLELFARENFDGWDAHGDSENLKRCINLDDIVWK